MPAVDEELKHMPHAWMRTTTWPGPATGSGSSWNSHGEFSCVTTAARTVSSSACDPEDQRKDGSRAADRLT